LRSAAPNCELTGERDNSAEKERAQAGSSTVLVQGRRQAKAKSEKAKANIKKFYGEQVRRFSEDFNWSWVKAAGGFALEL